MSLSPALMKLIGDKKKALAKGGNAYSLKEGKNRLRLLPGWRKTATLGPIEQFWHDFGAHWIKDAKGNVQAVVGCYGHTYGRPCEFCDAVNEALKATTDDGTVKLLKEWKSKHRILVNALVRTSDKPNDVQAVDLPKSAFGNIVTIMEEYAAEYGNMMDLKTGMDFIIERSGKGMDTKYTVLPAPKSEPVDVRVLGNLIELDTFVDAEFDAKLLRARNAIAQITGGATTVSPAASRLLTGPGGGSHASVLIEQGARVTDVSSPIGDDEIAFSAPKPAPAAAAPVSDVRSVEPTPAPAQVPSPAPTPAPQAVAAQPSQPAAADGFGAPVEDDEISRMLDELKL